LLRQRIRDSAFIGHDYHAATRAEFHSSRLAQIERWTEVGHRYPAWNAVLRIETRDRRAWGRDDYRSRRRGWGGGCWGRKSHTSQIGTLLVHEPNHMRQRGVVAQLAVLITGDVVDFPDGREHLRLLDGVNPEIRFQIEVHVQHVLWIAGLFHHQLKDAFLHRFASAVLRRCHHRSGRGWLGRDGTRCGHWYLGRLW